METERPTVVVLGSFLASEYFTQWQRQQEFVRLLMASANVLYVERAAPGRITVSRVVSRLRKKARRSWTRSQIAAADCAFPEAPAFVRWLQPPASGKRAWQAAGRAVAAAVRMAAEDRGWRAPFLVVCGTPTEPWRYALEEMGLPYWYDLWERVLASHTYATTDRDAMRWIAQNAALMTTDTEVGKADWQGARESIVVVPHGAKEWAASPRFDLPRDRLYYVGSIHRTVDVGLLERISLATRTRIAVVGTDPDNRLSESADVLGWRAAGDIPFVLSDSAAGLVPYVVDAFGEGVYPTKVWDYLLAGTPVLSTSLPSLLAVEHVTACETADEFAEAFEHAQGIAVGERHAIREYALENGWSRRYAIVAEELAERVPGFSEAMR